MTDVTVTRLVERVKGDGATHTKAKPADRSEREQIPADAAEAEILDEFARADIERAATQAETPVQREPETQEGLGEAIIDTPAPLAVTEESAPVLKVIPVTLRPVVFEEPATFVQAQNFSFKELPRTFKEAKEFLEAQFPEYSIIREAGRGGFKAVFIVKQKRTGAESALKVPLTMDSVVTDRLLDEARLLNFLRNKEPSLFPAATEIRNINTGYFGILVDNIPTRISRGMPPDEALKIFRQMARAVDCLHSEGFIHGDLKRSTFGIDRSGLVKILDLDSVGLTPQDLEKLGHSLEIEQSIDREKSLPHGGAHTRIFLAPEQEQGEKYPATDVYHLSRLLYEVVTGRAGSGMLKPIEGALSGLTKVLLKGMEEDWKMRYQTITELLVDVEAAFAKRITTRGGETSTGLTLEGTVAATSEPDEAVAGRVAAIKRLSGKTGFIARSRLSNALKDPSEEVRFEALRSLSEGNWDTKKFILENLRCVQKILPNHLEELGTIVMKAIQSYSWESSAYDYIQLHKFFKPDRDFERFLIFVIASSSEKGLNHVKDWIGNYYTDSPPSVFLGAAEALKSIDEDSLIQSLVNGIDKPSKDGSYTRVSVLAEYIEDPRVTQAFMKELDKITAPDGAVMASLFGFAEEIVKASNTTKEPALLTRIKKIKGNELNPKSLRDLCQAALEAKEIGGVTS